MHQHPRRHVHEQTHRLPFRFVGVFVWLALSLCGGVADHPSSQGTELWTAEPETGAATLEGSRDAAQPHLGRAAPKRAYELLALLRQRQGNPLPGYVGGREFQNRERRLPPGRYREYDVNPKVRGRPRDAERIVIEQQTGTAYYTGDHYRTFIPLN
ncbi:MAG TPA: ribonuclease domain-containing protein [Nitrospira sp.]|nr:ribonuclease domain-containing protein [Nitrospira sp.]